MPREPRRPTQQDFNVLDTSREARDVKRAAVAFAASPVSDDHMVLGQRLASSAFLERLDLPEDYEGTFIDLRLARVIKTLMDNQEPSANQLILGLIHAGQFQAHVLRMQLEIRALAVVRPSPPPAIQYWDRLSSPVSPIAYDVIEALCVNQSAPAMQLLENKIADPTHERFEKLSWMRELILPRRIDDPLLACCGRLVTSTMPVDLRADLVEALFHYKPDDWYIECEPPKPPTLEAASERAKQMFIHIARFALEQVELNPGQRIVVEDAFESLTGEQYGQEA
jgi:hypothetical protein